MLLLSDFSKSYNGERAVSAKSLSFPRGIHWVKGENGSGKTTFFKCIAGISPCEGEITLNGISLKKHPVDYRKQVTYAEAEPAYPSFLTANDLVRFVATARKAASDEVNFYIDHLGISAFLHKRCGACSSGMLKKLSLAIAFLGKPKLIILDEPLITLDEATRVQLYSLIRLRRDAIFLISSHDELDAEALSIQHRYLISNTAIDHA